MDTMRAFAMGMMNRGREMKVFDWDKAAKIIKDEKPDVVYAGLDGDFEYTGGVIYKDGDIVTDDYTWLASTWAVPTLYLEKGGEITEVDCYVMESETEWHEHTKWPQSAVDILTAN